MITITNDDFAKLLQFAQFALAYFEEDTMGDWLRPGSQERFRDAKEFIRRMEALKAIST